MTFENKTKGWVFCLAVATLMGAAGCGVNDKLNDMHDKTNAMANDLKDSKDTMQTMPGKMDKTNSQMADLKLTSTDTIGGLRTLLMNMDHQQSLEHFLSAKDLGKKLLYAGNWYYTLTFQGYNGRNGDDLTRLESFKNDGAEEFIKVISPYMVPDSLLNGDFKPLNEKALNRMALGATMGRIYFQQKIDGALEGFAPTSILSMVGETLRHLKKHPYESVTDLRKEHEYIVTLGAEPDSLVAMLQARLNFLALYVYTEITKAQQENSLEIISHAFSFMLPSLVYTGNPYVPSAESTTLKNEMNLYDKNLIQIEDYIYYIKAALRTKRMLIDFGASAELDPSFHSAWVGDIYKNMNFNPDTAKAHDKNYAPLKPVIAEFVEVVEELKMPWQDFLKVDQNTYIDDRFDVPLH